MMQHILFARDFSPSSEQALTYGLELARRCDATLHMLAVKVRSGDPFHAPEEPATSLDRMRERFKEWSRRSFDQHGFDPGSLRIHHAVKRGQAAAPAILGYAEEHDIDLIVMGTHGRRGVRRALLGSVTEEVVRLAPCPVLAVRAPSDTLSNATIRRIVVPVDFSDPSREALAYGAQMASVCEVPLAILHVIEDLMVPVVYGVEPGALASTEVQERTQGALDRWADAVKPDLPRVTTHVRMGHAARCIVDFASREGDLIVLATQGRTGLERVLMGSVAENVMRMAFRPVIAANNFT